MITTVSIISIILYTFILICFRRKLVEQQFAFLVIYLFGLVFIGELDILLPIYFVFSFIPFIRKLRKISVFTALISLYFIVLVVYGLTFQNSIRTIVTFITKIWQFVVFFIIWDEDVSLEEKDYKPLFWFAVIFETVLGIYLMINSTSVSSVSGLVRLVSNSQPITGNIATFMLPLTVLFYLLNRNKPQNLRFIILANLFLLVWIVLSGTRGYMLEYVSVMAFIIYDYYLHSKNKLLTPISRVITAFSLALFSIVLVLVIPGVMEKATSVLRLNASVGIRKYENAAVFDYIRNAPLSAVIFGLGLGGTGSDNEAMRNALYKQFSLGMWNRNHYIYESGALFHSLYSNVIMCLGLFGLLILVLIFVKMWNCISVACKNDSFIRILLHAFLISFYLMNYYRWSAVCGIAEMILLALVLKIIRNKNEYYINEEETIIRED